MLNCHQSVSTTTTSVRELTLPQVTFNAIVRIKVAPYGFCSVITGVIEIRRCPHESRVECSWPAIIRFFTFKVKNIVFADIFVFLHTKKTTVLPYNRLCFKVQLVGALNQS